MAKKFVAVSVVKDNVKKNFQAIANLLGKEVLIGIPEDKNTRSDGRMNNATIAYIQEFGSPAMNIPARPFLIPGVQAAEKKAIYQLRLAADAAMEGNDKDVSKRLNAAGIVGSNAVRDKISSNIPPPLSPSTIRNRHAARGTAMRQSEQVYLKLISKGATPFAAQMDTEIVSLVNTGQLRNSITYVIRDLPVAKVED